ncbi:hypothetical protein, partial [Enterococcus faecalis]|uniref:hypothetical protein n=1 Tax=Enterococcus faecalis TaxID=1351 RepID=UPI003D6AB577
RKKSKTKINGKIYQNFWNKLIKPEQLFLELELSILLENKVQNRTEIGQSMSERDRPISIF